MEVQEFHLPLQDQIREEVVVSVSVMTLLTLRGMLGHGYASLVVLLDDVSTGNPPGTRLPHLLYCGVTPPMPNNNVLVSLCMTARRLGRAHGEGGLEEPRGTRLRRATCHSDKATLALSQRVYQRGGLW